MTQQPEKTKPSTRGAILGQFIAAQRLQGQGVQQSIGQSPAAQVGQGQRFTVQDALGRVDEFRARMRSQTGYQPGLLLDRRALRRAELFSAVKAPRTIVVENSEPKEQTPPSPPAAQPAFTCPWVTEGCTFKTDSPEALQTHVELHTRGRIRTY